MTDTMLYEDILEPGCHWSLELGRGQRLRLIDEQGGANLGMLLYNPHNPLERLNLPDTLKCQHTFKLTAGHCLYSDMGRVFCSIVDDTVGWHDAACGTCDRRLVERRWGRKTYQQAGNDMHRNGLDGFLIELAKYGLGKKDLAANVNFFSRVIPDQAGKLTYVTGASKAGDQVTLRFEMDTLAVIHNCPHPLDPASEWPAKPVRYQILPKQEADADDSCLNACEENRRGFLNNYLYQLR
ncbi:MAG: urea carboxylase-associated family protein [Methylothermaceae bacterium]|nr:urea carboxylase-associated family protein [Methylothermaceae bacterium]